MLNAWYRKAIKADFNTNDSIEVGSGLFKAVVSVKGFWRQSLVDRVLDSFLITFLACGCVTLIAGLPWYLHDSLSVAVIGRILASGDVMVIIGVLLFPLAWLFSLYLFGIYTGFLRYVARHQ